VEGAIGIKYRPGTPVEYKYYTHKTRNYEGVYKMLRFMVITCNGLSYDKHNLINIG